MVTYLWPTVRSQSGPTLRLDQLGGQQDLVGDEYAIQSDGRQLTRQVTKVTQHRVEHLASSAGHGPNTSAEERRAAGPMAAIPGTFGLTSRSAAGR